MSLIPFSGKVKFFVFRDRCTAFTVRLFRISLIISIFEYINTDNPSHVYKANRNCP